MQGGLHPSWHNEVHPDSHFTPHLARQLTAADLRGVAKPLAVKASTGIRNVSPNTNLDIACLDELGKVAYRKSQNYMFCRYFFVVPS